jgi:competence protein ComEC
MGGVAGVMLAQRGHLIGWVPVCLGIGIGCYFSITAEPGPLDWALIALAGLAALLLARRLPEAGSPLAVGAALCLAGFLLAGIRAHSVAGPVLDWRYYGPVEGRIVAIDRSQSDAPRLTLDRVRLDRVPPGRTPLRVRLSLHGQDADRFEPMPGARVMTTAHLSPPAGPVEPGGFDFQRHAWFERLGAVGYTRVPVLMAARAEGGGALFVFRLRMAASAHVRAVLPGDVGGFAAAVTTGDRSGMSRSALQDLRAANLAHLLAISGLHMGLLTAVVFGALRLLLAAVPALALRWPTKSIAACGALVAATGYLALSGGNVATERAYIMVAVALGALMLGRRALSLRAVAVAATLVLILRPEALTGPGFQMSFAATTALIAVFGWLRGVEMDWLPRWLRPAFAVLVSSAVAGAATAPIAAAHFNVIAHYGLAANLASVPLMGVLVIPAAVAALALAPLGLDWLALEAMGWGLRWILGVATFTAGLEGAQGRVPGPAPAVLPLLALGGLMLLLWQGRLRWVGLAGVAAAAWIWQGAARPALLIADSGTLVGMMTPAGRALSREKTAGFVARNWLENDGDGAAQASAAARWRARGVIHLSGKRALAAFAGCDRSQVVIVSVPAPPPPGTSCLWFDRDSLRGTGAVALAPLAGGWKITTARAVTGDRPWTRWPEVPAHATVREISSAREKEG